MLSTTSCACSRGVAVSVNATRPSAGLTTTSASSPPASLSNRARYSKRPAPARVTPQGASSVKRRPSTSTHDPTGISTWAVRANCSSTHAGCMSASRTRLPSPGRTAIRPPSGVSISISPSFSIAFPPSV